eukprot:maker-scaffold77_size404793-snap-gene-0.17 protein:Tk04766 transcript:maker-scaffold77_size404793-snap-gene-0.17-mRNA-1 annotation:"adp-ribosylation factor-binding protein gga3-like isoform x2"
MASEALESLLFKATNPSNKIEDVNTIKKFCDEVQATKEGPAIACKLMAHKIQSPQEREAIQTLAVLEACVKSCGEAFHVEVGKFKFLNEMIKLVSPRYLASKTPEHIQKKIIEMLFLWTKDLEKETKIREAYEMLKKQGIVKEDPAYMGEAVFASSLPPRADTPLTEPQTKELKKLLQSKSPEDLEKANKIIKGMVKEDERKMDLLTRRSTELIMVNNNSKLLNEMLDHFDRAKATAQELELLQDLQESCEKMQPKLFRLASDTDDNDDSITEILQASDDLTRVLDRYKMVAPAQSIPDLKLTDLEVPISSIKPGTVPPLTLQDCDDGISIVLHFGKEQPRPHVSAVVVTTINKSADPLTDFELRAVVPKGCKVKLQAPSGRDLPPHNPFVPPPAITQVMLISNPKDIAPVSLKYVLTFVQDGDAQTEMGEVKALPLPHP